MAGCFEGNDDEDRSWRSSSRSRHSTAGFTIRRKMYRGVNGYLVFESSHKCDRPLCFQRYRRRFFCASLEEAERMRDEMKRGLAPLYDDQIRRAIGKGMEMVLRDAGYRWQIDDMSNPAFD